MTRPLWSMGIENHGSGEGEIVRCVNCKGCKTRIIKVRVLTVVRNGIEYDRVKRRRLCKTCNYRFTTYEMIPGVRGGSTGSPQKTKLVQIDL